MFNLNIKLRKKWEIITNEQSLIYFLGYLCIFILLVLRQWEIVGKPFLWAEDGNVFIYRAINNGFSSLFIPYAGYYHFLPQLLTNIFYYFCRIIDNVVLLPYMMWGSNILISSLAVGYFLSERFEWILKQRLERLFVCCIIILLNISEIQEVYGTVTNIHWWLGFYFFLISLNILYEKEMPSVRNIILLTFCGFSTLVIFPLFVIFSILLIYKIIKHCCNYKDILKYIVILIPCVIQTFSVLMSNRITTHNFIGLELLRIITLSFFNLIGKLVTPQNINFYNYRMILLGIFTIIALLYFYRKNKKFLLFSLSFSFLFFLYCALPLNNNIIILVTAFFNGNYGYGGRYWFISSIIIAFLISVALIKHIKSNNTKISTILAIVYLVMVIILRFDINLSAQYTSYYKQFASLYSNNGTHKLRIPIPPEINWHVSLPSNSYLDSLNSLDIQYNFDTITDMPGRYDWVNISGWMYDNDRKTDFKYILIENNGTYYPMIKTIRQDVADYFQLPNIFNSGFEGLIPKSIIQKGENTLNIVGIHVDKINYSHVEYTFLNTIE